VQRVLPPGIAANAIARVANDGRTRLCVAWAAGVYGVVILRALSVRLRAQYRGENLSEVRRDAQGAIVSKEYGLGGVARIVGAGDGGAREGIPVSVAEWSGAAHADYADFMLLISDWDRGETLVFCSDRLTLVSPRASVMRCCC